PRPSLFLFHRLHFDWATRGLFVLEVRREQMIRRDSQYIRSAARRLPTLFHRLHFGWATGCFPSQESGLRAGGPGDLLVKPSFARRLLSLFTDYTLAGQLILRL